MSRVLKGVGVAALVVVVVAGAGVGWVSTTASAALSTQYETHRVDIPVPFPLTDAEIEALRAERAAALAAEAGAEAAAPAEGQAAPEAVDPLAGVDLEAIALQRAIERGEHLVLSRYACVECHGKDFSGGVMVDDPAIGTLLGRNLTLGQGSVTTAYTMADWDRIVRHGVKPDGTGAVMPSEDYLAMSDQELSDIVAYVRSMPAKDAEVAPPAFGPVGKVLLATGEFKIAATMVHDHQAAHAVLPPEPEVSVEFGAHVAKVCSGCHNPEFSGGPRPGTPPDWATPLNLTPHEEGLAGWTFEQFETVMRQGVRPDGSQVKAPMSLMPQYAARMTDTEMRALWAYLQQLPPKPTPQG